MLSSIVDRPLVAKFAQDHARNVRRAAARPVMYKNSIVAF